MAEYLRIHITTVDRLVKDGKLPVCRVGDRIIRFCLEEVQEAMTTPKGADSEATGTAVDARCLVCAGTGLAVDDGPRQMPCPRCSVALPGGFEARGVVADDKG